MIGDKENRRLLTGGSERRHHLANLVVKIGDIGEIGAAGTADVILGDGVIAPVVRVEDALCMGVVVLVGHRRYFRQQVRAILVEIPVFPPCHVRVMRMGETDRQTPGPRIVAARQVIDLLHAVERDLVIVFHLVGNLGHARARDRSHVVIPPVDPFAGLAIVRRPAEIGGIDVRRQPLLESMQLIRADEMHLARKAGLIARSPQVMGIGGNVGGEFGGIVVNAAARG